MISFMIIGNALAFLIKPQSCNKIENRNKKGRTYPGLPSCATHLAGPGASLAHHRRPSVAFLLAPVGRGACPARAATRCATSCFLPLPPRHPGHATRLLEPSGSPSRPLKLFPHLCALCLSCSNGFVAAARRSRSLRAPLASPTCPQASPCLPRPRCPATPR